MTAPFPLSARSANAGPLQFPKRPHRHAVLAALTCGTLACAQAQTPPDTTSVKAAAETLQTVVVSGSRSEQRRDDLPVSMDVLGTSELENQQIGDIRDVARELPNVSVTRAPARFTVTGAGNATGRDGNAGFNIRGLGGNRVLMLVDGIRLPRSYVNGNNAFGRDTLSLDLLKRIELVRGPSSVLYGSDGLAGLVNFITHEPEDFLTTPDGSAKPLGGRVAAAWSGDDNGLRLGSTLAGRASDTVQWLLTGTVHRASGLDNMGSNDAANVDRTTPNPQTDRGGSLLGKLVLRPDASQKHVLTLEHVQKNAAFELLSSRLKPPLTAASVVDENAQQTLRRDRLTWDARYTLGSAWADQLQTVLSLQDTAAQDDGRTLRQDGGARIRNTSYNEHAWQAGVQAGKTLPLSAQWSQKLTYGLDYASTAISSWFGGSDPNGSYTPRKYFPDTRDTSTALYAQSEFISERWSITPGLRLEHFALDVINQDGYFSATPGSKLSTTPGKSLSGSNASPKLGVLYRATPQWSVFGNYASGFRAPDATQLNGFAENVPGPTGTTFVSLLSNPDLKPETSRSLELGVRARLARLSLDASVFSGRFNQLIVDKKPLGGTGVAGDPLLFQSVNVDNATIRGFEFKGKVDWGRLGGGRVSTPFAYGQTRGTDNGTGRPLNSIDPAKLVLGLSYETTRWDWRLDATHRAAKTEGDLESPYLPKPVNPPRVQQFTVPAATTLDLSGQWRIRKDLRLTASITNLTNRKYWLWSDVQGLAANSAVVDAYTQPGRHLNLSAVMDF
ncbi:MAG: TonB-dependent hemoglobin/transferrin/lactoferrin family receptor [Polaromonas sp.]|nr:TonB-dependent hemoglobin/transferrin/lactoferrin family receptor [Polaromonas sp.]